MALKLMHDNNEIILAKEDARIINSLSEYKDYIVFETGEKFNVASSKTSLKVTLKSGQAVICGRNLVYDGAEEVSITLSENDSGYIVLRADLSQSSGKEVSFLATKSLETDKLNENGIKRDLILFEYKTDSTGVTEFIDKRQYDYSVGSGFQKIVTLSAEKWSDKNIYTIEDSHITQTSTQIFFPVKINNPPSEEDLKYLKKVNELNLADAGQTNGKCFIYASQKPGGDIPIMIKITR